MLCNCPRLTVPVFLGLVLLISGQTEAAFIVRDVQSTGTINSLAAADALLAGTGVSSESIASRMFIDMFDSDNNTRRGYRPLHL